MKCKILGISILILAVALILVNMTSDHQTATPVDRVNEVATLPDVSADGRGDYRSTERLGRKQSAPIVIETSDIIVIDSPDGIKNNGYGWGEGIYIR